MRILVACEYSGIVRDAFIKAGHYAVSCDILPTESPGPHYQGDVMDIINDGWDMMIGHPPCTYLTNAGVRWLYNKDGSKNIERWGLLDEGAKFFRALWDAQIPLIALENPIPHKYAVERIGRKYDQVIQPWQFGHGETKAVGLWLKGLAPLKETNRVDGRKARVHMMPPGPNRAKERSRFFPGIAEAMATQWA